MNLQNPIIIDDKVFDKAIVNLAVSTTLDSNGNEDINMAIRFVPTRIDEDNNIISDHAHSIGMVRGKLTETNSIAEQALANNILILLQNLINEKI